MVPPITNVTCDWHIIENCPAQIDTEVNGDIGLSSIHVVGDRTVAGTFFSAKGVADMVGVVNTQTVYNSIPNEYRVKIRINNSWFVYLDTTGLMMYLMSSKRGRQTAYFQLIMSIVAAYSTSDVAKIQDLVKPVLQVTLGSRGISTIDSGIYMICIGKVRDLKHLCTTLPASCSDDDDVYKYGKSDNIHRRMGEHSVSFKDADLKYAVYIASHLTSTAERAVSSLISSHSAATRFPMNKHREIFSVPAAMAKSLLDEVVHVCRQVSAGGLAEEQRLVAELERVKEGIVADNKLYEKTRATEAKYASQLTDMAARENEGLRSALRTSEEARKAAEDARLDLSQKLTSTQAQLIELAMLAPARKRVRRA
ncbi:hypothetical protein SARC_06427 [Sphaeroforma arctica JP610]|uniref:Bacteriophage T5 Orf172 DNA-binding domain-containing protein n=1 Tax=Sphaeroforma arctica JP610 TaxID=667725 RepID=A0A0L0FWQ3_9EUKA|nr:hypothetical protein SARC_06427 [Sphaeroforma arctica JP610]KNC81252.1 hypothetical protein SARC_06427 [Sphaeroforma arctica JP610]|eukprot:XP_014155154.1 hypothetical protein SARC_06427 [Sphaeroforma arctica JP610]